MLFPAIPFKRVSPVETTANAETDRAVDCPSEYCDWDFRRLAIYQQKTQPRRWEARLFPGETVGPDRALREKGSA
jgi:hypothetical protein